MKIITFSGLDGSGKSTQMNLLKDYLKEQGHAVYYFHVINFSIANVLCGLIKNKKTEGENAVSLDKDTSITKSSPIGVFLRTLFLPIDILRFKKFIRQLENEGFTHVVTDRYFFDQVVNIEFLKKQNKGKGKTTVLSPIPQPDHAFFIDVKPEKIMTRENPPEQGLEYLEIKNTIWKQYFNQWNVAKVDGDQEIEKVFSEVKKIVG